MLLKNLAIGDVFTFHGRPYIKLSNKYDETKSVDKQEIPNVLPLDGKYHYSVIHYRADVKLVKSLKDYKPEKI